MKKYLISAFSTVILMAGCTGQLEKSDQLKTSKEKAHQSVIKEEEKETEVKKYIYFSDEQDRDDFKKAFASNDRQFNLLSEDNDLITITTYYPKQKVKFTDTTRFVEIDSQLTAADGYTSFYFVDGIDDSPNNGIQYELTTEEMDYIDTQLSYMTDDYVKRNETAEDILKRYEPIKENFEKNQWSLEIYGSAGAEFYSVMEATNSLTRKLLGLAEWEVGYNPNPFIFQEDIDSHIKLANQIYDEREDLDWLHIKNGTDDTLYEKHSALTYVTGIDDRVKETKFKIEEIQKMKTTLRPMITYYEKLAEYQEEKIDGTLMDEETIKKYEETYDTYIEGLEKELNAYEEYLAKVNKSKWKFSIE